MNAFTPPNRPQLGAGIERRFQVVIDSFVEVVTVYADDTLEITSEPGYLNAENKILANHPEKHTPGNQLSWRWLKQL